MPDEIRIIDQSETVERLFEPFQDALGDDFKAYRGHVYRVITYAMHFLGGNDAHRKMVETAFVYHDIGLWTKPDLAYLEPSEELALRDNVQNAWGLDPEVLRNIIHWHHKITPYHGPHAHVVNACRKGDWIDATGGRIRKGLTRDQVAAVEAAIPSYGFAGVLQRLAADLGGSAFKGNMRVLGHVFKL